jgi:hypothetical protein
MSAKEDITADMASNSLIEEIDAFLAETGMGASYFGKQATGNSEIVKRLREGRRVWPETEKQVRDFIKAQRRMRAA